MKKKLTIGTAQFGLDYGISNTNGEVSLSEIEKLLWYANENDIKLIDTAKGYGRSESKLGEANVSNFNIITKLSDISNIENDINDSLEKLKISTLYAVLVHDFKNFLANKNTYIDFKDSELSKKVNKIGFSLNKISELEYLLANKIKFDIVQVPYNLLDQRFANYFLELKNKNIEIHTRSVFLQGLFFMDINKVSSNLEKLKPQLNKIKQIATQRNISIEQLALNFVALNNYVDSIVVGVSSLKELKLNINALNDSSIIEDAHKQLLELKINDENLILPMNWDK